MSARTDPDQQLTVDYGPREYFGGVLHAVEQVAGLTFSDVEYREARQCRRHTHSRAFLAVQLRGAYSERFRTRRLDYGPFDVGFHPEGTEHADEVLAPGTRFFLVEMERGWLECMADTRSTASLEPTRCTGPTAWPALRLYEAFRRGRACAPLALESLVLELLGGMVTQAQGLERSRPAWVDVVTELLRTDFADALTVRDLAESVGRHPVYLSRAFRHFCGVGIGEYLREVRMRAVMQDLSQDHPPLAEVALRAGFSDQSRLTKVVKRTTGMTPGRLRRLATGIDERNSASRAH